MAVCGLTTINDFKMLEKCPKKNAKTAPSPVKKEAGYIFL